MVLRRRSQNPPIALQIGLAVGGHDATHRRPQLHDPDMRTNLEDSLQPAIFDKPLKL